MTQVTQQAKNEMLTILKKEYPTEKFVFANGSWINPNWLTEDELFYRCNMKTFQHERKEKKKIIHHAKMIKSINKRNEIKNKKVIAANKIKSELATKALKELLGDELYNKINKC